MSTSNDPALCHYGGADSTAAITSNDDGTYTARCHCGTVVTAMAASTEEASALLDEHRGPNPNQEG